MIFTSEWRPQTKIKSWLIWSEKTDHRWVWNFNWKERHCEISSNHARPWQVRLVVSFTCFIVFADSWCEGFMWRKFSLMTSQFPINQTLFTDLCDCVKHLSSTQRHKLNFKDVILWFLVQCTIIFMNLVRWWRKFRLWIKEISQTVQLKIFKTWLLQCRDETTFVLILNLEDDEVKWTFRNFQQSITFASQTMPRQQRKQLKTLSSSHASI